MFSVSFRARTLAGGALSILMIASAHAGVSTADAVLDYDSGDNLPSFYGEPYDQTSAALGLPDPSVNVAENDTLGIYPDNSIVTPFSAEYNPANEVAIAGAGGYIELHMSQPVSTNGFTIGVHTGAGLEDSSSDYVGVNSNPAQVYTTPRSATVMVSDGTTWATLGTFDFNNPTNIYTDISGPYTDTPGTQLANFAQSFTGNLTSFDGQDFAGTLATLDGSAGGTWLNLSASGLSQVDDIVFETDSNQTMFIDSVVGIPVPEPTSIALLILPALLRRRR